MAIEHAPDTADQRTLLTTTCSLIYTCLEETMSIKQGNDAIFLGKAATDKSARITVTNEQGTSTKGKEVPTKINDVEF